MKSRSKKVQELVVDPHRDQHSLERFEHGHEVVQLVLDDVQILVHGFFPEEDVVEGVIVDSVFGISTVDTELPCTIVRGKFRRDPSFALRLFVLST